MFDAHASPCLNRVERSSCLQPSVVCSLLVLSVVENMAFACTSASMLLDLAFLCMDNLSSLFLRNVLPSPSDKLLPSGDAISASEKVSIVVP